MPELPEVETMVRGIRPHVEGRRIEAVQRPRCRYRTIDFSPSMRTIAARSHGQRIIEVCRLAKRIILQLESGHAFVIEPRMTGLMLLSDPPDRAHLRFEWRLEEGSRDCKLQNANCKLQNEDFESEISNLKSAIPNSQFAIPDLQFAKSSSLWFWDRRGLGTLRLYSPEEMAEALGPTKLGPDALAMTLEDWTERLARTARPIKVALLDQKLVAGIGNLYASEILHLARIHPAQPSRRLRLSNLQRLRAATRTVLETAIRYEGSTLADGTYRNALNQYGGYQNEHRVYARAGERCPTCRKSTIQRIVQAQRSTFFCSHCQRRGSATPRGQRP